MLLQFQLMEPEEKVVEEEEDCNSSFYMEYLINKT